MATGKYEKDCPLSDLLILEGSFVTSFLPSLPAICSKIYLFLLNICAHPELKINSVSKLALACSEPEDDVREALETLNKRHLINYTSSPFAFEIRSVAAAKNLDSSFDILNSYADYFAGIRALLPSRSISPKEYDIARDWIEIYGFSPEAALLLVAHCIEVKDTSISFKYMDTVALAWANDGVINVSSAEEYIALYQAKHHDAMKLLMHFGIKRVPTVDEVNLYKKWTNEFGYDYKAIVAACSATTKTNNPTFAYLDRVLTSLYQRGLLGEKEIKGFLAENDNARRVASAVLYALGERNRNVSDAHLEALKKFKFTEAHLYLIANLSSSCGVHSFNKFISYLEQLSEKEIFDEQGISEFFASLPKQKPNKNSQNINREKTYQTFADTENLEV